jgi:hypothetical protein
MTCLSEGRVPRCFGLQIWRRGVLAKSVPRRWQTAILSVARSVLTFPRPSHPHQALMCNSLGARGVGAPLLQMHNIELHS